MWEPPTVESDEPLDRTTLLERLGGDLDAVRELLTFEHRTTHRDVVFHVHLAESGLPGPASDLRWQPLDSLDEIGLSNPHRRAIAAAGGVPTDG